MLGSFTLLKFGNLIPIRLIHQSFDLSKFLVLLYAVTKYIEKYIRRIATVLLKLLQKIRAFTNYASISSTFLSSKFFE